MKRKKCLRKKLIIVSNKNEVPEKVTREYQEVLEDTCATDLVVSSEEVYKILQKKEEKDIVSTYDRTYAQCTSWDITVSKLC